MVPAIRIDESARVIDKAIVEAALARCAYRLPGAIPAVFGRDGWLVVEQAYDLPDVYACYMEVQVDAATASIPIRCPMNDLYWLYVLFGNIGIKRAGERKAVLRERARHYRLGYLPSGDYNALFEEGHHQLFYVVHKPSSLFREDSDEFVMETAIFNALKEQVSTPAKTDSLSMNDGSMEAISRFLVSPGKTALKRRQAIHFLAFELVFKAYASHCQGAGGKAVGAEWAVKMKAYIDECIETGEPVDMHTVADKFRVSVRYVRLVFEHDVKETIGSYIINRKLAYADVLMDQGYTPGQAAGYLGWSHAHFCRLYRSKHGYPPGRRPPPTVK